MPKYLDIERVPVNWQQVTGKTWAITGLRVAESANSIYIDSSTGRASGYYFDELGIASTGIYATSGQFSVANPVLTWGLVHPAREGYPARGFASESSRAVKLKIVFSLGTKLLESTPDTLNSFIWGLCKLSISC